MDKFECPCGYIYDPEEGDFERGVDPEVPFEETPQDWLCPKCDSEKEFFEKLEE